MGCRTSKSGIASPRSQDIAEPKTVNTDNHFEHALNEDVEKVRHSPRNPKSVNPFDEPFPGEERVTPNVTPPAYPSEPNTFNNQGRFPGEGEGQWDQKSEFDQKIDQNQSNPWNQSHHDQSQRSERDELFEQKRSASFPESTAQSDLHQVEGGTQSDDRMEKIKNRSIRAGENAIAKNANTIELVHSQIEQTRGDNRRLVGINEKLEEAEGHLKDLNKGFWNMGKRGHVVAPGANETDVEIAVTITSGGATRWSKPKTEKFTLRFTETMIMKIGVEGNQEDKVMASYAYRLVTSVVVKNKAVDILIGDQKDEKDGVMCVETREVEPLVRTIFRRKRDLGGQQLEVVFEPDVEPFDYEPPPSFQVADYLGMRGPAPASQPPREKDAWGLNDDDDFLDATSRQLDVLDMQGKEIKKQLGDHHQELDRQKELVGETNGRVDVVTTKTLKTDKKIGGSGKAKWRENLSQGIVEKGVAKAAGF